MSLQAGNKRAEDNFMRRIRKVHFVGIGGAGMSGIADVMHKRISNVKNLTHHTLNGCHHIHMEDPEIIANLLQ